MNRLLIILSIIFTLTSCSSKKADTKLYGKCKIPMYGCYQVLLKDDKTFEQYIFSDVGGENIVKGTWEIFKGDTLKLNSYAQPAKDEFFELEVESSIYLHDELVILKNSKITFLEKPYHRKFSLKRNKLKNKKWN